MITRSRKTDSELQRDVLAELDWGPSVNAANIGVVVSDGIVTPFGFVSSYLEKKNAETIVKRVPGVMAVADELEVRLPGSSRRCDTNIARAAIDALIEDVSVPQERIQLFLFEGSSSPSLPSFYGSS